MKTKPITLILTLLFCLNGTVFAEDKKEKDGIISYKAYKDLPSLNHKHFVWQRQQSYKRVARF